jgi:hypothetical protein
MFISGSKTFYAFLNFSEETYVKKTENGLRSGLIAIIFFVQIFSRIWIGYSGVDSNQVKKFRARPDADPQPCPLEQVHILGTGKKISCKLEEIEKQYTDTNTEHIERDSQEEKAMENVQRADNR